MTRGVHQSVAACALTFAFSLVACSDDDGGGGSKPGMDGGTPSGGMDSGTRDSGAGDSGGGGGGGTTGGFDAALPPPLTCGGEPCMVSAGAAMLGTVACCTEDDECGGQSVTFGGCIALGSPGSYDETCPDIAIDTGFFPLTFAGCCTPEGQCGGLDNSAGGFGCIPGSALPAPDGGATGTSCTYDPTATCTSIVAAYCDGEEDCPSGQQCCSGGFSFGAGYTELTCQDSCVEIAAMGGIWSQVCHPGDDCDQPIPTDGGTGMMPTLPDGGAVPYTCLTSQYLPDFLYRCRNSGEEPTTTGSVASGEINCGGAVCGAGEKCCIAVSPVEVTDGGPSALSQGVAHCVAGDDPCTCAPDSDKDGG